MLQPPSMQAAPHPKLPATDAVSASLLDAHPAFVELIADSILADAGIDNGRAYL